MPERKFRNKSGYRLTGDRGSRRWKKIDSGPDRQAPTHEVQQIRNLRESQDLNRRFFGGQASIYVPPKDGHPRSR